MYTISRSSAPRTGPSRTALFDAWPQSAGLLWHQYAPTRNKESDPRRDTLRPSVESVAAFQVADQPGPVVGQVADSLTQRTLRCDVRLCLVQPAFQLLQDRVAFLLPYFPAPGVSDCLRG